MHKGAVPKHKNQASVSTIKTEVSENTGVVAGRIQHLNVHYPASATDGNQTNVESNDLSKAIKILENKARREYGNTCPSLICQHRAQECSRKSLFVEPTLYKQHVYGAPRRPVKYEKLFISSKGYKRAPQLILLLGNAGIGKSKLAYRIANDWSVRLGSPPSKFKLVILFTLTEIDNNQTFPGCIFSKFEQSLISELPSIDLGTVLSAVRDQLLIVLDGYDEVSSSRRAEVTALLDKDSFFHSSTILVTSRPEGVNERFTRMFQRIVTMAPLSKDQRYLFIDKIFNSDLQMAKVVKQFLEFHQLRFLALECTHLLFMICELFEKGNVRLEHKDSKFISEIVKVMVLRSLEKENPRKSVDEEKLANIAYRLGKVFLAKLKMNEFELFEKDFEVFGASKKAVKKCGLFETKPTKQGELIEVQSKAYIVCLAVHYMNEKLKKLKTVQEVHSFVRKNMGEPDKVKTIVFKKALGYLALWGDLKDIVYVTQGAYSIFNGSFLSMLNLKEYFGQYTCKFKSPSLPGYSLYDESRSVISMAETFDEMTDSESRQVKVHVRGSKSDEPLKLNLCNQKFPMAGYLRLAFVLEDKTYASRVLNHKSCDESCYKLNSLPQKFLKEDFLKTVKSQTWNIVIYDKSSCFKIDEKISEVVQKTKQAK